MSIRKHIPNTITSMNLLAGAMGVVFTVEGWPDLAFILMILAAVFDFLDGFAARMLNAYSPIGKELDSLSDMVSFGLLPSVMLVHSMGTVHWWRFLPLFLVVMSGLRLAKFNIDTRQSENFIGVPTPTAAMISGSMAYLITIGDIPWLCSLAATWWFLPLVALALGLLLVSEIPMFGIKIGKGHKVLDAKRIVFFCLAAAAIVFTILTRHNWSLAVLLIFLIYIVQNLILAILKK